MSVVNVLNAALYSTLTGGTALTALLASGSAVYYQQAPDNATLPFVVFSHQAGGPDNITAHNMRNQLVYVRGYASTPATAGSIDAQISNLIHKHALSVSGYTNFWTVRETDVYPPPEQLPNNERVYSAGAVYRVRLTN
jgi:hypothetical protein